MTSSLTVHEDIIQSQQPKLLSPASSAFDLNNVFTSPHTSSSSFVHHTTEKQYFRSRRVRKEDIQREWVSQKDPRRHWQWIFPVVGIVLGVGISLYLCIQGYTSVPKHQYCSVLDEDFSSGILNPEVWTKEVQVGGFGNGQFEMTTDTDENAYIQDGSLIIKPTLQNSSLITHNSTLNLLGHGCTSESFYDCVAVTNTTNGTIISPVKSARLNTKKGASIKYGRVEVRAQFPAGDWLWPAIWLLPTTNQYGAWPASGEIDIAESRGNNASYPKNGNQVVESTLHFGPDPKNDGYSITTGGIVPLHSTLASGFHTFGLEWSEKYIFTWLDSRLLQVFYLKFNQPFWNRGGFGSVPTTNGTPLVDPWGQTGQDQTPFDTDFYLILNVAVGGTNGYFPDYLGGKPWVDASPRAKLDFWNARDQWYPTWSKNGQMIVQSVKMWQQAGYNGC